MGCESEGVWATWVCVKSRAGAGVRVARAGAEPVGAMEV